MKKMPGSQPFISPGVFSVEVTNVSDGNSGDEPGEHQGNFSEAEEQVRKDNRNNGEDVTGGDGDQGIAVVSASNDISRDYPEPHR